MFGAKLKALREASGHTQAYMAEQLGIKQSAYSKLETNQANLTADMVKKLAIIFNVSPVDILTNQPAIINFESVINGQHGVCQGDNILNYSKDIADKIITSKDEEISRLIQDKEQLKSIIDALMKDKDQLMELLKSKI